jgi:hypothetical protein
MEGINQSDIFSLSEGILATTYSSINRGIDSMNDAIKSLRMKIEPKLKKVIDFIWDIVQKLGLDFKETVDLFRNREVYDFFSAIKFSFKVLFSMLNTGLNVFDRIANIVSNYLKQYRIFQWEEAQLIKLDNYLKDHPYIKRVTGAATAALLLFIWFRMAFTGNPRYDFGMGFVIASIAGKFSLATILGGTSGIKLLMLFSLGYWGGYSFPWAGPAEILFIGAIMATIAYYARSRLYYTSLSIYADSKKIALMPISDIKYKKLQDAVTNARAAYMVGLDADERRNKGYTEKGNLKENRNSSSSSLEKLLVSDGIEKWIEVFKTSNDKSLEGKTPSERKEIAQREFDKALYSQ